MKKFNYTSGCINTSLSVDGKETINMSLSELKSVVKELIDNEKDFAVLQEAFKNFLESQGKYESFGPCSVCGEFEYSWTLEL